METIYSSPIKKAASLAGGVAPLAAACDVSPQAVYKWIRKGRPPSFERCIQIEAVVRGQVSRFDLLYETFSEASKANRLKKKPSV